MDSKCTKGSFLYTGCDAIDEQHQGFFKLLEKFNSQIDENDNSEIADIISELYLYSIYHFETEEKIFSQYPSIDFSKHLNQHQAFSEKVEQFNSVCLLDNTEGSQKVLKFMKNWLTSHIQNIDVADFKAIEELEKAK
ncbi:bacteriohemerythrin [Maridesulfovibrio frigidus]|uniref:bacteriohemerythrin n=1 Tax=Maridesulfovibrio frigidus TaxID=340956 RepID=UPI0004E1404E|nr:hemerythrin family protein [Maridesulfovibrio frigidus]